MDKAQILIDNGVDVKKGLELLGDIYTYNEMLDEFMAEIGGKMIQLKEYYEKVDLDNYAILVHALKSEVKYFGFDRLAEILYQHETESKRGNIGFVHTNYDKLIEEIKKTIVLVKEYREQDVG